MIKNVNWDKMSKSKKTSTGKNIDGKNRQIVKKTSIGNNTDCKKRRQGQNVDYLKKATRKTANGKYVEYYKFKKKENAFLTQVFILTSNRDYILIHTF
jgi:hypothetical protein